MLPQSLSHHTERKYSTTEKERLAVFFAVEKLRSYLQGTKFTFISDHYSLKWLFNIKYPAGRITRWALLQQFDFDVIHTPGKDHLVPNALSRTVPIINSIDENTTASDEQSEPEHKRLVGNMLSLQATAKKPWEI